MTDKQDTPKLNRCIAESMVQLRTADSTNDKKMSSSQNLGTNSRSEGEASGLITNGIPSSIVSVEPRQTSGLKCKVHKLFDVDKDNKSGPSRRASGKSSPTGMISKESLSQMVVNVRDLSSNLSNITMKLDIKHIFIISKITDPTMVPLTQQLALWLLQLDSTHGPLHVSVEDVVRANPAFEYEDLVAKKTPGIERLHAWTQEMCKKDPDSFDFVISLGGDGTVLFTSWLFQNVVPPVLSIGMGSLGFMTEYMWDDRHRIISDCLINGVSCSLRMRFSCTVFRAKDLNGKHDSEVLRKELESADDQKILETHEPTETFSILNEVLVDRGPNPIITTTEMFLDYKYVTTMQADGVVISTPSGSTAYSLSAGGSLVHPDIPALLVSPICAHTLSFRPIIVPDAMVLRIAVPYDARTSAWCAFDGKHRIELRKGDFLAVSASRYPFPKVNNGNGALSWFDRLTSTLHWNERKRQKAL